MHVDVCYSKYNNKVHKSVLLRVTLREEGKVKHKTILNLTKYPEEEIEAMRLALKHKGDLSVVGTIKEITTEQGTSVGSVALLYQVAQRLGIAKELGNSREGKLVLWQVIARLIEEGGSRLSATRLAAGHAVLEIMGLEAFNEDHLYNSLTWLEQKQEKIEKRLYKMRSSQSSGKLFLYDVTSSYLEGQQNELGDYGYNRDKKKGKKQIVVGLLTNEKGDAISVQVYRGNTQDIATLGDQIKKAREVFGVEEVIFVGDKGMIKLKGIEQLQENGFHYITSITKSQIRALLNRGVLQLGLFDEELAEAEYEGIRYIVRRNPFRAEEIRINRLQREEKLMQYREKKNDYLSLHRRAGAKVALKDVKAIIAKLKLSDWLRCQIKRRKIVVKRDTEKLESLMQLDGCYVLKTDVPVSLVSAEIVHQRYKDLALIEDEFKTAKTEHLHIRPIYLRREDRTRAHVFIVMLSLLIRKELERCWNKEEITVNEGINELSKLCSVILTCKDRKFQQIPFPNPLAKNLLQLASANLPTYLPARKQNVYTRKKIASRRKSK